jgi:hypothetical protein
MRSGHDTPEERACLTSNKKPQMPHRVQVAKLSHSTGGPSDFLLRHRGRVPLPPQSRQKTHPTYSIPPHFHYPQASNQVAGQPARAPSGKPQYRRLRSLLVSLFSRRLASRLLRIYGSAFEVSFWASRKSPRPALSHYAVRMLAWLRLAISSGFLQALKEASTQACIDPADPELMQALRRCVL